MEDIPAGVQNNIKIIDDTMLYEGGMEEGFFATCKYVDLSVKESLSNARYKTYWSLCVLF